MIAPLVECLDAAAFGGKTAALARALAAGLPVPAGFGVSTTAAAAIAAGDPCVKDLLRERVGRLVGPLAVAFAGREMFTKPLVCPTTSGLVFTNCALTQDD